MVTDTIIYKTHIKKPYIDNIVLNKDLSKKDMRIIFLLFTKLSGYYVNEDVRYSDKRLSDPQNHISINIESIAETLEMDKKEVKKSIKKLVREGILDDGSSSTVKHGYRFTF